MSELSITHLYEHFMNSSGVTIDSRKLQKGQIFFAVKGENFDGHAFVQSCIDNGASLCVIQDPKFEVIGSTLLVDNVLQSLQDLARYHRMNLQIPFIGITGSNGKTTTKELIYNVLSQKYKTFATQGNYNNHLGVPLSILSIKREHEMAIIEMGANHPGEIAMLSEICMPDYGLITNIGKAHLEGFGDLEGVRLAKTELYNYLDKIEGSIFFNYNDTELLRSLPSQTKNIGYGHDSVQVVSTFPTITFVKEDITIASHLYGRHNLINMLAATTIGSFFGVSDDSIRRGIENYEPSNNRSQVFKSEKNTIILDAYNANPSSMKVSISELGGTSIDKKVLILGHMLELGKSSIEEHTEILTIVDSYNWAQVYLVGSEFGSISRKASYTYFEKVEDMIKHIVQQPLEDATILLKGSRGIALEQLIPFL